MSSDRTPQALASAMRSIEAAFLVDGRGATLEGATEVWLVRHGDCYEGITGEDPSLSAQGIEQARRLAARMRKLRVDAVYASPLRRALETAGAITDDVRVDERLVEVHTELEDGHVQPSEQPDAVLARMRAALADIVAAHPGGRIVVIGHALAIMAYLCDVLRVEFGTLRLLPYYTSVNIVRVLGDRRMVGSLADVAHLEG
ncbi:MAG TPA: histidine phosphatase family protein [Candidatus Dormibacteraeota bacterium]|nr:histidine phosphatase family protein [Candidatus Dormibacteraeota bacterium]